MAEPAVREVAETIVARATSDGAGVRLKRSIGSPLLDAVDPFLLLDEFRSDESRDYIGGFPDHPHRGFETVTYMLAGSMRHQDSRGNQGDLSPGSIQWMTAGRGIIHSEMPRQVDGLLWGFQLWVNLPARLKMTEPRYQDIPADQVPEWLGPDGARVRVIAGTAFGQRGPVAGIATDPLYLDVQLPSGASFAEDVAAGHNAFLYVFDGEARVGAAATPVASSTLAVLGPGDRAQIGGGPTGARFLLVAARPLGEPIARYGPFVMNTKAEIEQAIQDYRNGTLAR